MTGVQHWRIGAVDVVRVVDMDFPVPAGRPLPDWCVPDFAPSRDEYRLAFSALAIRDGGTTIVVDPWMAHDNPRTEPTAHERVSGLLETLASAGFAAADVDLVVNSHLDGIGWNTRPDGDGWGLTFPRARYSYPADEVAAIDRGDDIDGAEEFAELARLTSIDRVEGTRQLTPSVSLEPAPGHNAGHHAVRIESEGELAIYLGHLVLTVQHVIDPGEDPEEAQTDVAAATRRRYLDELADRGGLLLTTLVGGPGGGRVRRDGTGYQLALD
jgi:glyoxylase-like metal-dependent hydrolase (beta-lactamase superfamily II)